MGMSFSTADLPRDPDDLRRVAGDLQRDVAALSAEVYAKTLLIEKLKMQLAVLRRARFGRSSERLDQAVEQLELLIGDIEETEAENEVRAETAEQNEATAPSSSKRRRQSSGRAPLPDHLPQEVITHEPDCVCPVCGGGKFSKIGADEREVLEYVPPYFKRVLHVRPKMSCLRDDRAGADALLADRERAAGAGASGSCARVEVRRSPASAPPGGHLRPQRGGHRSLDDGGLGRPYGSIA
jgi:transposase